MKITACLFFWSITAAAYPEIGDRVDFEGSELSRDGSYILIEETRRVSGFDRLENAWLVEITEAGPAHRSVRTEKQGQLFGRQQYDELISLCDDQGGRAEAITVPAGKFETCYRVTADSGLVTEAWYGNIPFGVVKKVETHFGEGRKTVWELSDWVSGEPESPLPAIPRSRRPGNLLPHEGGVPDLDQRLRAL